MTHKSLVSRQVSRTSKPSRLRASERFFYSNFSVLQSDEHVSQPLTVSILLFKPHLLNFLCALLRKTWNKREEHMK